MAKSVLTITSGNLDAYLKSMKAQHIALKGFAGNGVLEQAYSAPISPITPVPAGVGGAAGAAGAGTGPLPPVKETDVLAALGDILGPDPILNQVPKHGNVRFRPRVVVVFVFLCCPQRASAWLSWTLPAVGLSFKFALPTSSAYIHG